MRQRKVFQDLETYVLDNELTIQQVQGATLTQVYNLMSWTEDEEAEYKRYQGGIKKVIIQYLQSEIDKQWLIDKWALIKPHVIDRFPDATASKDFHSEHSTVTIHLDGEEE